MLGRMKLRAEFGVDGRAADDIVEKRGDEGRDTFQCGRGEDQSFGFDVFRGHGRRGVLSEESEGKTGYFVKSRTLPKGRNLQPTHRIDIACP